MRKVVLIIALPITIISQIIAWNSSPQQKTGIARINYVIMKLPEMKKIEVKLKGFEAQLQQVCEGEVKEYELKFEGLISKKTLSEPAPKIWNLNPNTIFKWSFNISSPTQHLRNSA